MTIAAAEAGKDIYCEKPLGLTIGAQQKMVAAVRKNDRVLQTGTHHRSDPIVAKAAELVKSGAIGEIKRVVCTVARNNRESPGPGWQPMPVPVGFDYDLWLGPAPEAPYHKDRCLYNFRFNYDYAGGQVTNFGVHTIDMAQRGLGTDLTGPVEVEFVYADYLPEGSLFNTATNTFFRCRYANGTVLECYTSDPAARVVWEGTEGTVRVDAGGTDFFASPSKIWPAGITGGEKSSATAAQDHVRNFIDCCKSRQEPIAPVEVGHRSTTICHLGNIAIKLQAKLTWDPSAEKFTGRDSEAANALLDRSARGNWVA
jgi:predicted dehydrogenase